MKENSTKKIFCPFCGEKFGEGANFCMNCGEKRNSDKFISSEDIKEKWERKNSNLNNETNLSVGIYQEHKEKNYINEKISVHIIPKYRKKRNIIGIVGIFCLFMFGISIILMYNEPSQRHSFDNNPLSIFGIGALICFLFWLCYNDTDYKPNIGGIRNNKIYDRNYYLDNGFDALSQKDCNQLGYHGFTKRISASLVALLDFFTFGLFGFFLIIYSYNKFPKLGIKNFFWSEVNSRGALGHCIIPLYNIVWSIFFYTQFTQRLNLQLILRGKKRISRSRFLLSWLFVIIPSLPDIPKGAITVFVLIATIFHVIGVYKIQDAINSLVEENNVK